MNSQPRRVQVALPTKLESIDLGEEMACRVALAAGFDEDDQHKISMAVRESLINAFQHGNQQDRGKSIGLDFLVYSNRLVVVVSDEGRGFRLEDVPDPRSDERLLKTSGRGIFLMRTFMDKCQVERGQHGGAAVTMTKYLGTPAGQGKRETEKKEKQP